MTHHPPDAGLVDRLGDRAAGRLLDFLLKHDGPPPERRVFVNRTLRLETIGYVGFDLDWTLADYQRLPLQELIFQLTLERLIDHHGYPNSVRAATFRPDFPRRGLLIDRQAGTVLGMSRHRYVNRAYLGRDRLDRAELKRLYRYEPIRPTEERFYHLDSLFELPEANLYAELIELSRLDGSVTSSPQGLFDDVRSAIDWVHAGPLKRRVLAEPERYLERSEELALALCRLALRHRRLFLLTNSDWHYANGLCSHLFDGVLPGLDSWRQLFDLVIVGAAKPSFFREGRPFVALDESGNDTATSELPEWGGVYREGCLDGLMGLIAAPGDTVLYVGDHIYGDIVSSKMESTWRTVLIVRELEDEIGTRLHLRNELEEQAELAEQLADLGRTMDHLRDIVALQSRSAIGDEPPGANLSEQTSSNFRQAVIEHGSVLKRASRRSDQIGSVFSPYWDSFFKQGSSKTRFASQLETYACLYTSRVANFAFYGTDHYFRVARDPMMHEL